MVPLAATMAGWKNAAPAVPPTAASSVSSRGNKACIKSAIRTTASWAKRMCWPKSCVMHPASSRKQAMLSASPSACFAKEALSRCITPQNTAGTISLASRHALAVRAFRKREAMDRSNASVSMRMSPRARRKMSVWKSSPWGKALL